MYAQLEVAPAVRLSRLARLSESRLRKREILIWLLSAAALYAAVLHIVRVPLYFNDGYQYLSVAANILGGHGIATDLPFFDSELRHGVIPAPVTTFPPGYPMAVAALQGLGLGPASAAVAVSITSGGLTVGMIGLICRHLHMDAVTSRYVLFVFGANAGTLTYSISVLSESLFTLLVTAALLAVLTSRKVDRSRATWTVASLGGVAVGAATWVRYAGLFLFAGIALALLVDLAVHRTRRAAYTLMAVGLPATLLVAPLIARNILLVRTWQGGNTVAGPDGALRTLMKAALGLVRLAIGNGTTALAVAAQVTVAIVAIVVLTKLRHWPRRSDLNLVAGVLAVYIAAIVLASLNSPIDIGARLLFPAFPLMVLAGGIVVRPRRQGRSRRPRTVASTAVAMVGVCAYFISGCTSLDLRSSRPHDGVTQKLAAPLADGSNVIDWLAARNAPEAPVMATDSQATSYALRRPVVGMAESRYSSTRWDEVTIAGMMKRYRCRYLIIYTDPGEGSGKTVQSESPFLESVLAGRAAMGFSIATRSEEVIVLERHDDW